MLRSLFVGVLALSALVSCKDERAAPAVAVGTAAGKVVEITGTVEATRDGKTRALAIGAEVFADDQIATGADGTVTIELFHNNARWAVVSNKRARVDASLAWGLDKQAASATVEHHSAAAGRNAERSAAESAATVADEKASPAKREEAAAEPAAAAPAPESAPNPTTPAPAPPRTAAPPPAPPPAPQPAPLANDRSVGGGGAGAGVGTRGTVGGAPKGTKKDRAPETGGPQETLEVTAKLRAIVDTRRAQLNECRDPQAPQVILVVRVVAGKVTGVELRGDGNLTDKVRACMQGVVAKLDFGTLTGAAIIDLR